jgi:ACS family hexuronate transporter-like MFS transporter
MPANTPALTFPHRGPYWKWCVCGLLLLATMINYMDRLTLNLLGVRIMEEFKLDEVQYGHIESAFAVAFALGAIVMGCLADYVNVRWLYAASVIAWSLAGFITGYAQGFVTLLLCRFLLGLAEAGNWPCALRTTQHILKPEERTMGNGILQSGAAIGAVLTPLVVLGFLWWTDSWRHPFFAIGAFGLCWVFFWFLFVSPRDLEIEGPGREPSSKRTPWFYWLGGGLLTGLVGVFRFLVKLRPTRLQVRRFCALVIVVVCINASWHFFRAWMPLFLQRQHHYTETQTGWFTSAYYICTDAGSLFAGFATLYLARRGFGVHHSRLMVYLFCALLAAQSVVAAVLPPGPLLLGLLLVVGFGALGVFPNYYSFSQELTVRHQGKLTGVLGASCWLSMAGVHEVVGNTVKRTGSYSLGVALAGLAPLVGFAALVVLWGPTAQPASVPAPAAVPEGTDLQPLGESVAIKPA